MVSKKDHHKDKIHVVKTFSANPKFQKTHSKNKKNKPEKKSNNTSKSDKNAKHLQRAMDLLGKIQEVNNCAMKNCKKQKAEFEKKHQKKIKQVNMLMKKFISNRIPRTKENIKKMIQLKIELQKTDEKRNQIDCQLQHCYKQTHVLMKTTYQTLTDPKVPVPIKIRQLAKKYKKLFGKTITSDQIIQENIDTLKIKNE